MDASGTKLSIVEVYVEAIRQKWRDRLREEEGEEEGGEEEEEEEDIFNNTKRNDK